MATVERADFQTWTLALILVSNQPVNTGHTRVFRRIFGQIKPTGLGKDLEETPVGRVLYRFQLCNEDPNRGLLSRNPKMEHGKEWDRRIQTRNETLGPVYLGTGCCQFFLPLLLAGFLCFLPSLTDIRVCFDNNIKYTSYIYIWILHTYDFLLLSSFTFSILYSVFPFHLVSVFYSVHSFFWCSVSRLYQV